MSVILLLSLVYLYVYQFLSQFQVCVYEYHRIYLKICINKSSDIKET